MATKDKAPPALAWRAQWAHRVPAGYFVKSVDGRELVRAWGRRRRSAREVVETVKHVTLCGGPVHGHAGPHRDLANAA